MSQAGNHQLKYRPDIDGLRSIAVGIVILFHAGASGFSGGYIGVDVFFVISGFLIGSIIHNKVEAGTFRITEFYERRFRRILPILFFIVLVFTPLAWHLLPPSHIEGYAKAIMAISMFGSNIYFYNQSGYFGTQIEMEPLIHTWSLSVEEQFYVVYPLLIIFLHRYLPKQQTAALLGLFVISLGAAHFEVLSKPDSAFFLLPFRAWELLLGTLGAIVYDCGKIQNIPYWLKQLLCWLGLSAIAACTYYLDKDSRVPGLTGLIPTVGALAIVLYGGSSTTVGRLLSLKPFVTLGLMSYSIYLWHQPLFAFARHYAVFEPTGEAFAALTVLTLVLSYLSWRFIENPIRHRLHKGARASRVVSVGALASIVMIAIGGIHLIPAGESRSVASVMFQTFSSTAELNFKKASDQALERAGNLYDNKDCIYHDTIDRFDQKRFGTCSKKYGPATILIGDSHARDLYQALAPQTQLRFVVSLVKGGCRPAKTRPYCGDHYSRIKLLLTELVDSTDQVIYTQTAEWLFDLEDNSRPDLAAINKTFEYLGSLTELGVPVRFWLPRSEPGLTKRQVYYMQCLQPESLKSKGLKKIELQATKSKELNSALINSSKVYPVKLVEISRLLDFDWQKDLTDCKQLYWSNESHWSSAGEMRFGKRLISLLEKREGDIK
ncbi:MAG: acyltransferase [Bdellovibrionales bacterium]|nr:acyltransferase [Bdellovibrionales bacterium]